MACLAAWLSSCFLARLLLEKSLDSQSLLSRELLPIGQQVGNGLSGNP